MKIREMEKEASRRTLEYGRSLYAGKPATISEIADLAKRHDAGFIRRMIVRAMAAGSLRLLA